ncbi:MAG: preprotein translocase subunit YajC [Polyangiaceae bacterium]|nr:preprotein translocase subunit YajC [Polyangiaceae bacterium]
MSYSFLQPAPAPGRNAPATGPEQPAPAPAPTGDAPQPPGGLFGGASSILILLLPLLLIFLMTRTQTKKQKQLESNLKVGDRVLSQSGLIGKIVDMGERTVKMEIAPGVNVQMLKSSIQGLADADQKPAGDAKQDAKAKEPAGSKDKPQEKKA